MVKQGKKGTSHIEVVFIILLLVFLTFIFIVLFKHWDVKLDEKVKSIFDKMMDVASAKFGVVI